MAMNGWNEQARWLDARPRPTIRSPGRSWPFTNRSIPPENIATSPVLQDLFVPILDKYRVDLVLQGHDHTYSRSARLKNGVPGDCP